MCGMDACLVLLALLFPPLPVWVKRGLCSADSLINIALCCLGVLPGLFHAWYIIYTHPDPTYSELAQDEDPERGGNARVTHYYVQQGQPRGPASGGAPQHQRQQGYGTVGGSSSNAPAGPSGEEVPPSYAQAVKGDHKVQGN